MDNEIKDLLVYDAEHVLHSLFYGGKNLGITFERADGVKIFDSDGKEYIDCASQLVNVNLGHNHRGIIEAAKTQMGKMMYATLFRGFTSVPSIEYARKLSKVVPTGLDHFLFTLTGGDADDSAFKIANLYHKTRKERRYKIISLFGSYHGTLRGTGSVSGLGKGSLGESPVFGSHIHIPNYFCYRCSFHKEYPGCDLECAKYLDFMIENEGEDSISCFIAEPVIGAGGFIAPPLEYFPRVKDICRKHGVLYIADEVMTGFGRTGKMFAVEHWGIKPDIMTLSKGIVSGYLPFGTVCISQEVFDTLRGQYLGIGSTESGNPVCCAVASKVLDIYKEENIIEHTASIGRHVRERLEKEFLPLPHVGTITGLGLMQAIHLVKDKKSKTPCDQEVGDLIQKRALEKGLFPRVSSGSIQFAPPLTITKQEVDEALDRLFPIVAGI